MQSGRSSKGNKRNKYVYKNISKPNLRLEKYPESDGLSAHYTHKHYMDMRRIIRKAQYSQYFRHLLIKEIEKKLSFCDTILNTPYFKYYDNFFRHFFYSFMAQKQLKSSSSLNSSYNQATRKIDCVRQMQRTLQLIHTSVPEAFAEDDEDLFEVNSDLEDVEHSLKRLKWLKYDKLSDCEIDQCIETAQSSSQTEWNIFDHNKIQFSNHLYSDSE